VRAKKIFLILITFLFIFLSTDKTEAAILRLNIYKENEKVSWDNDSPEKIQYFKNLYFVEPQPQGENNHEITILSFKEIILKKFKINLQTGVWTDYVDSKTGELRGGFQKLTGGKIKIDLPYYPNASRATIFDKSGKEVFSADLSVFAVCNENDVCESFKENEQNCPNDCLKPSPPITSPAGISHLWFFILFIIGAVIVFIVLILFFLIKKKIGRNL